jgi:hypothetical protein|tara:strand:- start:80859 stop:81092 length:234 start_codon:yes stop_codon:yes gene_type:complete
MFDASKVKTWIPKKSLPKIEKVDDDSEVVEVILKDGFINSDAETVWVFSKESYECKECSLKQIKEDLLFWLSSVQAQ